MRFLSLIAFFALFAGLTSCLPDAAATLTPEVEEVIEEPTVTTNFSVNGNDLEITHGYLFKVFEDEAGGAKHHLVLTSNDVREGDAFTGNSEAITITINAEDGGDISGEYILGGNGFVAGTATVSRFYQNLRFSEATNYDQGYYDRGSVLVSRQGEEYILSFSLSNSFGRDELEGTFQGTVAEIDLSESESADAALFQGENQLKYGEREVELNHAYLLEYGNEDSGSRRYRLYLSEEDIAPDASVLTGRSDLIFFYVNDNVMEKGGKYAFGAGTFDYLSRFLTLIHSGYYCKNMDFSRNTADEDVPVEHGEVDVEVDGDEIIVAFTGQAITGVTTSGLYRGPIIRLD